MILFADSSALAKVYFAEPGSTAMSNAVRDLAVAVADLTFAEIHAAFSRRLREGLLTLAEHSALCARFEDDWNDFARVRLRPPVLRLAPSLCRAHPLRGADSVQLASALALREEDEVQFASSDLQLLAAASAEGLVTMDPAQVSG